MEQRNSQVLRRVTFPYSSDPILLDSACCGLWIFVPRRFDPSCSNCPLQSFPGCQEHGWPRPWNNTSEGFRAILPLAGLRLLTGHISSALAHESSLFARLARKSAPDYVFGNLFALASTILFVIAEAEGKGGSQNYNSTSSSKPPTSSGSSNKSKPKKIKDENTKITRCYDEQYVPHSFVAGTAANHPTFNDRMVEVTCPVTKKVRIPGYVVGGALRQPLHVISGLILVLISVVFLRRHPLVRFLQKDQSEDHWY